MASDLFRKYIWLADTIRRFGPIRFSEISRRWQLNTMSDGRPLALRTFHNHRTAIEELFDIRIVCDERTNRYSISDSDGAHTPSTTDWLLDSFSLESILHEARGLRGRVIVEEVPSAHRFLPPLLEAMRDNACVDTTYQPFYCDEPFTTTLQPLFVRLYERRWYLYADKPHESKIKIYALDRMHAVEVTERRFKMPAGLDPGDYLASAFGISIYDDIPPRTIRLRATASSAKYLRTLPLHPSQREVDDGGEGTVFEYYAAPTREFYQTVLSHMLDVEVLSPDSVRREMARLACGLHAKYGTLDE